MVLFSQWAWSGLANGSITVTFRRWSRPQAKAGGRYRTPAGMLLVHTVDVVSTGSIREDDARRAGFADLDALLAHLGPGPDDVYRLEFTFDGPDPRTALREQVPQSEDEVDAIVSRLDRLDRASLRGPWTEVTLRLIAEHPATRAADLAESVGRDKPSLKIDVRKLKALGLTESLEKGYRLSPRGHAVVDRLTMPPRRG